MILSNYDKFSDQFNKNPKNRKKKQNLNEFLFLKLRSITIGKKFSFMEI